MAPDSGESDRSGSLSSVAPPRLSPRQRECLELIYERKTSKEIATALHLSVGTVNGYVTEAVAILDARNRRHAAELLHAAEAPHATPDKMQGGSAGVEDRRRAEAVPVDGSEHGLRLLLPYRHKRASGNDLTIVQRFAWVFFCAIALAVGFGMFAVGGRVLSDILRQFLVD